MIMMSGEEGSASPSKMHESGINLTNITQGNLYYAHGAQGQHLAQGVPP